MNVEFGYLDDQDKPEEVKDFIHKLFDPLHSDNYDSIFVAYPHQCYSDNLYEPKHSHPKQAEIYIFSLPSDVVSSTVKMDNLFINGKIFALRNNLADTVSAKSYPSNYITYTDEAQQIFAVSLNNKLWILGDIFDSSNYKVAEEILKHLIVNFIHA